MISTTIRGRYEGGVREAVTTVTVHGGAVKLNGNVTEATFVNGSSLEGLSFSLEKPGSFLIDFDVPKQDVRFQFMNNMRVMEKPLNFTYTHWRGDNRTVVDGTLAIDSSNKLSANYGFDSGNCKLGYSYVHKGLTTFEPSYDFAKNSWDVALSQRVDEDNVVKASYQSSSKVLGLEWCKSPISSGGFKEPSHDFPLDECKGINGPLTSFLDMLTYTSYPNQPSLQESSEVHPNFASLVTQLPTLTPDGYFHLSRPSLVKISASVNLAEESKFPTLSVDSRLHVEL